MKVLVTGGAGFIGSNFVRWLLHRDGQAEVVNLDKLTYAGNPENLRELEGHSRYRFHRGDVADLDTALQCMQGCEAVVHFAAETHVDRSIVNAADFVRTNVQGTYMLLEAARRSKIHRYIQISTDEVYGSLTEGAAHEESPILPNSPYAASKAGADHLVRAYGVTFGLPAVIIRASNNFGPYQFPEKLLPLLITNALENQPLPIYGDGLYVREWLFVEDFCEAIGLVLQKGEAGQIYNVGSGDDRVNLEVAKAVLKKLGKPESLLCHVQDRLGHDRRYSIASDKIRTLGWKTRRPFEETLGTTIEWYLSHQDWWRPLKERARISA